MTLRVAVVTSIPVGNTGNVLARIAEVENVEIACLIVSDESGFRSSRFRRLKKIARIGPLGALNGYRIRSWFAQEGGEDAREVAKRHGIPTVDVVKVNHPKTKQALIDHRVDLGISLGNGYIASWIFTVPHYGFINYHGELLPEYPGGQSVVWPIFFGRDETGFTIHCVTRTIDGGDVLYREARKIRFASTLKETIAQSLDDATQRVPAAFARLLADWEHYWQERRPIRPSRHFTTLTWWQFLRVVRNNRRLFKAQAGR